MKSTTAAARFGPFAFAAALALATFPAQAAAFERDRSPADRGVAADIALPRGLHDLGVLRSTAPVRVGVLLRYRHEAELRALTLQQATKGSRNYHHYLTRAQWLNYFAPDAAAYARVAATLQRHGFRIEQTFPNRGMIRASAPAAAASRYFSTSFRAVMQAGRGVRYVNTSIARMPADLRADAIALSGLHSVVTMRFPLHRALRSKLAARAQQLALANMRWQPAIPAPRSRFAAATPAPGPDPTESPESPLSDETTYEGYGPPVFAQAYDYPLAHGYGGKGHAAGSVIDTDFSDADAAAEFSTFDVPRTGAAHRVCTDPSLSACQTCTNNVCAFTPDTEGESTLDAQAIMTLAPAADFYEYLAPNFDDVGIEAAYNRVVSDDVVDAVNSSFGGCETDDPSFEYATNYIATQGAALGITFSASTGDTGSTSCGIYSGNGAPQTDVGVSTPAADDYFTGVGGTDFELIVTGYYTTETAWVDGGGGVSVFESTPSWQTGVANVIATGRNIPDLAFTADPNPPGNGFVIDFGGTVEPTGGTSLSSPMWVAMLTDMAEEDGISGFGLVNPGIYRALADASYASYFHDVVVGTIGPTNVVGGTSSVGLPVYAAMTGYDQTTGAGTPLGFELGAFLK